MNKRYWEPVLCDSDYFQRLRLDYPDTASMCDVELHEHFNNSLKYQVTWDHIGDAYSDYEPLCDSYLKQKKALNRILRRLDAGDCDEYTLLALKRIAKASLEK